jgi:hypothetical protein
MAVSVAVTPGVSSDRFCSARELCSHVAYFTVYHIAVSFTAVRCGCLESSLNRLGAIGASEGMSRAVMVTTEMGNFTATSI